jgi:hypothetical protein
MIQAEVTRAGRTRACHPDMLQRESISELSNYFRQTVVSVLVDKDRLEICTILANQGIEQPYEFIAAPDCADNQRKSHLCP